MLRYFRECLLGRIGLICANVNCYVRLKNRGVISDREIVNDFPEEVACRFGRDKPVCDDGSRGHDGITNFGLTPFLQLHNVTFRIARINQPNRTGALHFACGDFSHRAAAGCDDGL